MSQKQKVEESSYSAGPSASLRIVEGGGERNRYSMGFATTPLGIVGIYQQHDFFALRVVYEGRMYTRREERVTSKRGLAIACTKFIARVVRGEVGA